MLKFLNNQISVVYLYQQNKTIGIMRTHFYNAQEVYTNGDRGDKKEALKIFNKFDANIKLKDIYSAINAPSVCPDTFSKSLNELL